jgi:hypothetical protein
MAGQPAHATDSPGRGAERGPVKAPSPDQVIAQAKKNLADTNPNPPKRPAPEKAKTPRAPKPAPGQNVEKQYRKMSGSPLW